MRKNNNKNLSLLCYLTEVLISDVRASACVCPPICPYVCPSVCLMVSPCICVYVSVGRRLDACVMMSFQQHATSMRAARPCSAASLPLQPGWSRAWRDGDLCGPMQCCYQRPPASNARPAGRSPAGHISHAPPPPSHGRKPHASAERPIIGH